MAHVLEKNQENLIELQCLLSFMWFFHLFVGLYIHRNISLYNDIL